MAFKKFAQLIMIEQTLFALPFAYLGVLFAGGATVSDWIWVTVAMAAARTAGMSFNRVIDARIDGKNPRTRERALPAGIINPVSVWTMAILSSLVLIVAAYMLNSLCFYLSFLAVLMLFTYSYFKRFTASSHFYLGTVEAAAPVGGYLAVTGEFALTPFILGFIIMMWIAGLDIVYALQDLDFDAKNRLFSIPVSRGRESALVISAACYVLAVAAMVIAGIHTEMPLPYWFGVVGVSLIFTYQQTVVRSNPPALAARQVFRVNMFVSSVPLAGTAVAVALR